MKYFVLIFTLLLSQVVSAIVIKGKVKDSKTGEEIIGATLEIKGNTSEKAVSGLDGSFSISADKFPSTIVCTFIGYKRSEYTLKKNEVNIIIPIESSNIELDGVTVLANNPGRSESGARSIEKQAMNVVNVMSAKAIELSPDITVANVIQRMSGVTVERSNSGEGQYAILRGMDKRYNYTLVNGVKIPSPDNKNRFVPLDIFPSELLDRLEVIKSLTADMEGDGIGGAVNMVMKDAPTDRQIVANVSTGYNSLFLNRKFQSFTSSGIHQLSPNELYGTDYPVKIKDFTTSNLRVHRNNAMPDLNAGLSFGDRFLNDKIGLMLAGSIQNSNRGNNSNMYGSVGSDSLQAITNRYFSEQQTRIGTHAKVDYYLSKNHKFTWYNGYMNFRNSQVRDAISEQTETFRLRYNKQSIFASILKGEHKFLNDALKIKWTLDFSKATNKTPDNTQINLTTSQTGMQWITQDVGATRRWEHNSDKDKAGYLDFSYQLPMNGGSIWDFSMGGMYRDKKRNSFFNEYTFKPYDPSKVTEQRTLIKGQDWNNFDEVKFEVKEYGNLSDPLNYDASEKIGAAYTQVKYTWRKLQAIAGLRVERTNQGFNLDYPTSGARNEGTQKYTDFLPDIHIKYEIHNNANLRFSYAKALNRPSFFEIVPYTIINEDYTEHGNPDLLHTTADNFDLRYEFFPKPSEQIMACAFYKRIKNPIEYGMISGFGQDTYYMPENYGNAFNYGLELDFMKYFNWFGIKANYTYTHSKITTQKMIEVANPDPNAETTTITKYVDQSRPLFGQAAHVVNVSLLFKDNRYGWDGQLAFEYTGKKICIVSRFYDNDSWNAGYAQLDASVEKKFKKGFSFFIKASDLLNTPLIQYINKNSRNESMINVKRYGSGLVEREDRHGQNLMIGIRYKLL